MENNLDTLSPVKRFNELLAANRSSNGFCFETQVAVAILVLTEEIQTLQECIDRLGDKKEDPPENETLEQCMTRLDGSTVHGSTSSVPEPAEGPTPQK